MKATGCKHLSYDETKYSSDCKVSSMSHGRALWERTGPNGFQLCQFCTKRGRLNNAESCTSERLAQCSDFVNHEHEVIFRDAKL